MALVVLLTIAGDQVPVTPLVDVLLNTGAGLPEHIGETGANVGLTNGITVTV